MKASAKPHRVLRKGATVEGYAAALVCQDRAASRALVAHELRRCERRHRADPNHNRAGVGLQNGEKRVRTFNSIACLDVEMNCFVVKEPHG